MPQPEEPIYGHIDLHTHSFYSDGSGSPRELLEEAKRKGLSAVALTDHDTVAGIPDLLNAAKDFPELEAIPGVELSSVYAARELHIVGLWIDHTSEELISYLEEQRVKRCSRNETMRKKLEEPRECYMTYTTERAEKEALKLYKSELGCNHQQAIEAYCRDWKLSGIDKSLPFAQKVNQTGHVLNLRPKE